jgi:hypothetical protein
LISIHISAIILMSIYGEAEKIFAAKTGNKNSISRPKPLMKPLKTSIGKSKRK